MMVKLKEKYYNLLFVRCITSTAVGEAIDSIIFITTAFYGVFSNKLIITMICCQAVFKVLYEFIYIHLQDISFNILENWMMVN